MIRGMPSPPIAPNRVGREGRWHPQPSCRSGFSRELLAVPIAAEKLAAEAAPTRARHGCQAGVHGCTGIQHTRTALTPIKRRGGKTGGRYPNHQVAHISKLRSEERPLVNECVSTVRSR